jgi:hypothetical protein
MELLEIIKIFKQKRKIFFACMAFFVLLSIIIFYFQPNYFSVDLTLNVSRKGIQKTDQYRYDNFYRLQADERFADTVVRWLGSPSILNEIALDSAGAENIGSIKASRLSSQMIQVSFKVFKKQNGKDISASILKIISGQIEKLDQQQKDENWFLVVAEDPMIQSAKFSFLKIFSGALLLGIFSGFWLVLLAHYFEKNKK